jgi:ATP-dependent RNA helicase DDX46/PRP5
VDVPRPITTWTQCGINVRVLDVLKRSGCERPLAIQAQVRGGLAPGCGVSVKPSSLHT